MGFQDGTIDVQWQQPFIAERRRCDDLPPTGSPEERSGAGALPNGHPNQDYLKQFEGDEKPRRHELDDGDGEAEHGLQVARTLVPDLLTDVPVRVMNMLDYPVT